MAKVSARRGRRNLSWIKRIVVKNVSYKGCIISFKLLLPVQNSQSSNPTVAKLLQADAELAAQEVELNAQITSVQQKRHSLKTVIDMFAPGDTTNTPVATPALTPVTEQPQPTAPDVALLESNGAITDNTAEAPAAIAPPKRQANKNSSSATSKQSQKSVSIKKSSQQADTWQQYVRDEFYGATLAEAVSEVMQQHEKQVLEIAAIVDAIFTADIPKELRSTARERVSNVLSVGAKSGKWFRGQLGKYSMSQAAVEG